MVCPAKDNQWKHKAIDMQAQRLLREIERNNYAFFSNFQPTERLKQCGEGFSPEPCLNICLPLRRDAPPQTLTQFW
jgi:hypothetical protein